MPLNAAPCRSSSPFSLIAASSEIKPIGVVYIVCDFFIIVFFWISSYNIKRIYTVIRINEENVSLFSSFDYY